MPSVHSAIRSPGAPRAAFSHLLLRPRSDAAREAGLAVALANSRQVRRFAEAMGAIEKIDRIDAAMIASFLGFAEATYSRKGRRTPLNATSITDPEDPRITLYRAVKERDVAGRGERFVAEGEVVLRLLLSDACRHEAESVLVSENRLDSLGDLLAPLPDATPLYVASQAVMDAIVGFHIHRGVLAIGRRAVDPGAAALLAKLPEQALVVALVGVSNHDNVGGIFRNAAAFGADAVLLDGSSCDPLYRKAIRVSVGASLITRFARGGSGEALLDALDAAGFETVALSPSGGGRLDEVVRAPRTALLFGTEGPGLPASLMARTRTARIDMAEGFDSLNVAVTSGVALYEMRRSAPTS